MAMGTRYAALIQVSSEPDVCSARCISPLMAAGSTSPNWATNTAAQAAITVPRCVGCPASSCGAGSMRSSGTGASGVAPVSGVSGDVEAPGDVVVMSYLQEGGHTAEQV